MGLLGSLRLSRGRERRRPFLSSPPGCAPVRRFFLTHGVILTRIVGVIFIAFGARSIADAARGAMRRTA